MCLCNAEVKVQDDIWINKIPTACDRRPLCTHVCVSTCLSLCLLVSWTPNLEIWISMMGLLMKIKSF